jgi:hypothetical protein
VLESRTDGAIGDEAARCYVAQTCALLVFVGGCSASTATMECRRAEQLLQSVSSSAFAASYGLRGPGPAATRTYELTLARAYLDKAREEASEAHYGSAIELAGASQRASQRVRAPHYDATKGRD